jgi:hypothetical protein
MIFPVRIGSFAKSIITFALDEKILCGTEITGVTWQN